MRGWRAKLVFMLVVYFGGFATAIYTLAPVPENKANDSVNSSFFRSNTEDAEERSSVFSAVKSDEFKKSLNTGIHKCFEFSKDATWRTARFIKQKFDERQTRTDS